jgi:hypothetical protein
VYTGALDINRANSVNEATFRRYLFWWSVRSKRRSSAFFHWIAAARARDRSFPRRLLASDLRYLLRNSAEATLVRTRYGRWAVSKLAPAAAEHRSDPYIASARQWVAQCEFS